METQKKEESMTPKESVMKKSCPIKKFPMLILLAVALVGFIVLGYFALGKENRENSLSFIDDIVISNDTLLDETEDIEEQMEDLPQDLLDSEVVDTQEIDSSIEELDTQLEQLDNLESDFVLETFDVGL